MTCQQVKGATMADVLVPRVKISDAKFEARMLAYRLNRGEVSPEYVRGWLDFLANFVTQNEKVLTALKETLDPALNKAKTPSK
jgi:hypothetical protein